MLQSILLWTKTDFLIYLKWTNFFSLYQSLTWLEINRIGNELLLLWNMKSSLSVGSFFFFNPIYKIIFFCWFLLKHICLKAPTWKCTEINHWNIAIQLIVLYGIRFSILPCQLIVYNCLNARYQTPLWDIRRLL